MAWLFRGYKLSRLPHRRTVSLRIEENLLSLVGFVNPVFSCVHYITWVGLPGWGLSYSRRAHTVIGACSLPAGCRNLEVLWTAVCSFRLEGVAPTVPRGLPYIRLVSASDSSTSPIWKMVIWMMMIWRIMIWRMMIWRMMTWRMMIWRMMIWKIIGNMGQVSNPLHLQYISLNCMPHAWLKIIHMQAL